MTTTATTHIPNGCKWDACAVYSQSQVHTSYTFINFKQKHETQIGESHTASTSGCEREKYGDGDARCECFEKPSIKSHLLRGVNCSIVVGIVCVDASTHARRLGAHTNWDVTIATARSPGMGNIRGHMFHIENILFTLKFCPICASH